MTTEVIKQIQIEFNEEELTTIQKVNDLINELRNLMKRENSDRLICDMGYGDIAYLRIDDELLDLSEWLICLNNAYRIE